ncbi:flagellar motor switch protein FliG [Parendozoicomonas haliclonae]|uniref:Flagellar motor switch protein FliG n=1 Tax=Parendozoicomonas haliclonae TaxID=1960125 RepID=A0A1X7AGX4_9GAMM|nr:flagellar motor switch protein FliG [Parendozoicomonas haliclonae]SMA39693.1 Flagellar motor switch protein FliG [Parendozoicomonas haliclonae]
MSEQNASQDQANSGTQNVAVLMLSLGEEGASEIFKHLSPQEIRQVTMAMAQMPPLKRDEVQGVLGQFFHQYRYESGLLGGTKQFLQRSLNKALPAKDADSMIDSVFGQESTTTSLEMIKWMDTAMIAEMIANEHPQLQAVVLAYLEPEQASQVLQRLPEANHQELLSRIARLEELHPSILQELNEMFDQNMIKMTSSHNKSVGGLRQVADLMNRMNENSARQLLEHFKGSDTTLADQIEEQMFVFEHLTKLTDENLAKVITEVPQETLALGLKGASDKLMGKILANMAKRTARYLQNDIDNLGSVRASQVQKARQDILDVARKLADSGEIELSAQDEEMIE